MSIEEQTLFGDDLPIADARAGALSQTFLLPPFTVLSARDGWWQKRKRAWISLGIQSELGRGAASGPANAIPGGAPMPLDRAKQLGKAAPGGSAMPSTNYGENRGRSDSKGKFVPGTEAGKSKVRLQPGGGGGGCWLGGAPSESSEKFRDISGEVIDEEAPKTGTSIFDPVLCELAYRWFCPPGGTVVDPFSGGSVRGIVAAVLGRDYFGVDLREEQLAANRVQAKRICQERTPTWVCGDSRDLADLPNMPANGSSDFLLSCPPYGDLERYSDDPADLSTMGYEEFILSLEMCLTAAAEKLKPNAFACLVVGDFRDERGIYRGFPADTVWAARRAGLQLYNEAILVTAVGSLPIRTGKMFRSGRKMGKTHQNVLIFAKGDPRKAADACGPVEFGTRVEEIAAETDEVMP